MRTYIRENELREEAIDKNLTVQTSVTFTCPDADPINPDNDFLVTPFGIEKNTIPISWNDLTNDEQNCVMAQITPIVNNTNIRSLYERTRECAEIYRLEEILNENHEEIRIIQREGSSAFDVLYRN